MSQVVEVVIVETFVTKLPVKALDVGVLRGLACCDQLETDTRTVGPAVEGAASEFGSLICANGPWQTAELTNRLQNAGYVAI